MGTLILGKPDSRENKELRETQETRVKQDDGRDHWSHQTICTSTWGMGILTDIKHAARKVRYWSTTCANALPSSK